jgi:hypothetical protein
MFTFLPLYYSDNYYNILHDKRDIYILFSLGFLAICILPGIIQFIRLLLKTEIPITETIKEFIKKERNTCCLLDLAVLLSAVVALVSACLSGEVKLAFTGEEAWDVGAGVILLAAAVYFVVSRYFGRRADVWFYIYVGSFAVLLIGVIDRLGYDFLIMHDEIPLQYEIFISTVGNVNFWGGYLAMLVPVFALAPVFLKSRWSRLFAWLFVLLAYFSCFITLTNTTYLGIGCGMLYVVWFSLRDKKRWKNLAANMILFMLAGIAAHDLWRNEVTPRPIDTDSVSLLLLEYRLYLAVGIIGMIFFLYAVLSKGEQRKFCTIVSRVWIVLVILAAVAAVVYVAGNYSLELFNYRGSIWYFSWNGYLDGSVKDKLIGVGPGLLDYVTQEQIAMAPFEVVWNYFYNTAHNDLLEYLVTTGIIGAVFRLAVYILPFTMMGTGKSENGSRYQAERAAILAGLAGYIGQGLVTGPYVLDYVLYMLLLGLFRAYDRKKCIEEQCG